MNPETTVAVLTFIAFSIPIVGALWKIFSLRESLQGAIVNNTHRLVLIEKDLEHLKDQQQLALKGVEEVCKHVRERSQRNEEELDDRILDLEAFLEKSTPFTRRRPK